MVDTGGSLWISNITLSGLGKANITSDPDKPLINKSFLDITGYGLWPTTTLEPNALVRLCYKNISRSELRLSGGALDA
jgi:hypothetical protein